MIYYTLLFIVFLVLIFFKYWQHFKQQQMHAILENLNPSTTIFAFDLHGTILKMPPLRFISFIWHTQRIPHFFSILLNPSYCPFYKRLFNNKIYTAYDFEMLAKKYPKILPLKNIFLPFLQTTIIDQKSITRLAQLNACGYRLYILSNINSSALEHVRSHYPWINDFFIDYFIPQSHDGIKKPHMLFYQRFQEYISKKEGNKSIIFIDDKKENIDAAKRLGIHAFSIAIADKVIEECLRNKESNGE